MTFKERYANMQNAGGNHKAQDVKGLIAEGRVSIQAAIDKATGTSLAQNPNQKYVKPSEPTPKPKVQQIKVTPVKR